MSSLHYTTATSKEDLLGIIELQKNNLPVNLTEEEMASGGFVTVIHSLADLKKLNDLEPHIICREGEKVIAYLLTMTAASRDDIPVLIPMFKQFDKIVYGGKPVSAYRYMVVGQVCVDKQYRGQGVLDKCYETYRNAYKKEYSFAITEVAGKNRRSLNAHKRVGFTELCVYAPPGAEEWSIVIWEW